MYTSISEYLKAKKSEATNETKVAAPKPDSGLAVKKEVKKLGSLLERLTYCHFILNKGLINESSSLKSINEAFKKEFNLDNFFKTDEQFNGYYVKTLASMKRLVEESGYGAQAQPVAQPVAQPIKKEGDDMTDEGLGDFISGVKTYDLKTIALTPKAAETYKQRPQLVTSLEKSIIAGLKCSPEEAKQVGMALFNFANGAVPNASKWNVSLIKTTEGDKVKVDPNGKGLFTGSNMF
jgi:hypothetical protein